MAKLNYSNLEHVDQIMTASPVMPVIVIEDIADAVPMAKALVEGGIKVLEVTLRTEAGLKAIELIAKEVPDAIVGAGTVTTVEQLKAVEAAGAKFAISPGATDALLKAGTESENMVYLPAIATPSEMMHAMDFGYRRFKLFPASVVGGAAMLNALSGPFGDVAFCPTGGINLANFADVLKLKNVRCVGGSWLTPKDAVNTKDWAAIKDVAKETVLKAQEVLNSK